MEEEKFSCTPDLFSSDDEVFTLQCPDFMTKDTINEVLKGSHIVKTDKHDRGMIENLSVEVLSVEKGYVTVASPVLSKKSLLHRVPLKGHILVQKSFKIDHSNENNVCNFEESVRFPDEIRSERHPLLGITWKAHLEAANTAKIKNMRSPSKDHMKQKSINQSFTAKRKKRKSSISDISPSVKKARK